MSPLPDCVNRYQRMWTTDANTYGIIVDENDKPVLVFDISDGAPLVMDDYDEIVESIIRNMLANGVPTVSISSFKSNTWREELKQKGQS